MHTAAVHCALDIHKTAVNSMIENSHLRGLHCPKFGLNRVCLCYSLVLVNGNLWNEEVAKGTGRR